jgi:hypothetical protein
MNTIIDLSAVLPGDDAPEEEPPHLEIARLREDNDDLRASALQWRELYESALRRANRLEAHWSPPTPADRLLLDVPEECPFCGSERITLETIVTGSTAVLSWHCRKCERDWSVTDDQQIRRGAARKKR